MNTAKPGTISWFDLTVPNLASSLKACVANGGKVLRPAKSMGGARMAVVRDPAGAVAALFEPEKKKPRIAGS